MTKRSNQFLYNIFVLICVLNQSDCSEHFISKANLANIIVKTLDGINIQNNKIKALIKPFFNIKPNEDDCVCVPFYLCNNGEINKDGRSVFQTRFGPLTKNPCKIVGDVCCEPYQMENPNNAVTEKMPENVECGYGTQIAGNYSDTFDVTVSKFGEYPWTALVLNEKFEYQCVGSLIHPEVILTSAHCVYLSSQYIVRMGEWNTSTKNEPYPHQNANVKFIVVHPKFKADNLIYNAALLFMEKPFNLDVNVNTACLADASRAVNEPERCLATGWGRDTPKGQYRRVMKKIDFTLISNFMCQSELRDTRLGRWFELHPSFICAVGDDGRDLCVGDGGGPLMCPIPGQPLRYQQVGITSWGIDCGQDLPSVFSKTSMIRNWIDAEFTKRNLNKKYYTYVHL